MKGEPVIDVGDGEINLRINTEIYPREVVLEALDDYTQVCWVDIEEEGKKFLVNLRPKEEAEDIKLEKIGGELMNYILGRVKNK